MTFITPKTNWTIQPKVNGIYQGDWFNVDPDYKRIVNNIVYVRDLLYNAGVPFIQLLGMKDQDYTDYPFADILNSLEKNVYYIGVNTPGSTYNTLKTWVENGYLPTVDDLNRWEQCILDAYNYFNGQAESHALITSDQQLLVTADGYVITTT